MRRSQHSSLRAEAHVSSAGHVVTSRRGISQEPLWTGIGGLELPKRNYGDGVDASRVRLQEANM